MSWCCHCVRGKGRETGKCAHTVDGYGDEDLVPSEIGDDNLVPN